MEEKKQLYTAPEIQEIDISVFVAEQEQGGGSIPETGDM